MLREKKRKMPEISKPNPGVAAALSFVFSGLGQIYNGQIKKGLLIIGLSTVSMIFLIIGSVLIGYWLLFFQAVYKRSLILGLALFLCGVISVGILGAYSIFDAYKFAKKG